MNKKSLILVVLWLSIGLLQAKERTQDEAFQIAGSFFATSNTALQKAPSQKNVYKLAYSSPKRSIFAPTDYFVFNRGENDGFIIVSGDDRATPVLGYSDSGSFDFSAIPENFRSWLSFYENELNSLKEDNSPKVTSVKSISPQKVKQLDVFATYISPLLGGIKWNQDVPYNDLCPIINSTTNERAASGCVATAMAQVMKYHEWPIRGTGSNNYTAETLGIPLTLDFSQTTFDWGNMTDTYSDFSTQVQNEAVATLMYNCGVAVNMDYNYSSAASVYLMGEALSANFGYDPNLQIYSRNYYTRSEWEKILKIELNANRPVLYAGFTYDSGHEFVCDGYDSNNLYHINWGWGGLSNGYFSISALDPNEQGIGGSTSGYNLDQLIVAGLQKPSTSSVPSYLITTGDTLDVSKNVITRTETFTFTAKKVYNKGVNTFNGSIAVALYNNSELAYVLSSVPVSDLKSEWGWSTFDVPLTLAESVLNGDYQLFVVCKADGESAWTKVRGRVGVPNYLDVTIDSENISFKQPSDVYPNLTLDSLSVTGNLYQDKIGRFNVSVTNAGGEYNSILGILLQSTTNGALYQLVTSDAINIASGETRNLQFIDSVKLVPGEYYLIAAYDPQNNKDYVSQENFYSLGNEKIVNVLATPTDIPILTLTNIISFPNTNNVDKNNAVLTTTIKNTAGFYDNKLIAFIFPSTTGSSLTYLDYQDALFDTNEEKEVTFSGSIDLQPGQYRIAVYSKNEMNAWARIAPNEFSIINFTLADVSTEIKKLSTKSIEVYPNPVRDNLNIRTTGSIHQIIVTDLLGKQIKIIRSAKSESNSIPVEDLKSGAYLIRVETDTDSKTLKFIKE